MNSAMSFFSRAACLACASFAALLVAYLCFPATAWGYFSYPAPSISVPESVELYSGGTQQVTCAVDPLSESQLPGCGMAECPQACDGLENPQTGVVGGCLDKNGWCTCAGTMYSTVTTNVSVSSSNPSVVRASWAGGVLSISGYRPGSATLTISASLAKHDSAAAEVSVEVFQVQSGSEPQQEPDGEDAGAIVDADAGDGGATSVVVGGEGAGDAGISETGTPDATSAGDMDDGASDGAATTDPANEEGESETVAESSDDNSNAGQNDTGANTQATPDGNAGTAEGSADASSSTSDASVSVTEVGETSSPSVSIVAGEGSVADMDTQEPVSEIVSREGERIVTARIGSVDVADVLAEIAESGGRVTFWAGGTADSPDVSLTMRGEDIDRDAVSGYELTLQASKKGTGEVAQLLSDVARSVVIDIGGTKKLPAKAEVYVRTSAVFDDGAKVKLFRYAEGATKGASGAASSGGAASGASASAAAKGTSPFAIVEDALSVKDGYVSFTTDRAGTFAVSDEVLESMSPSSGNIPTGSTSAPASNQNAGEGESFDASKVDVHAKSGVPYLAIIGVLAAAVAAGLATFLFMRRKARLALASADAGTVDDGAAPDGEADPVD